MKKVRPFEERIQPLHEEVRFLGQMLGKVMIAQEGKRFYDLVESVRKDAIALRRRHQVSLEKKLIKKIRSLKLTEITKLIRAFTIYFQLANLAEDKHRIRRKRYYEINGIPQLGSIEQTVRQFKQAKVSFREMQKLISDLSVDLVLTAHPTEAQRWSILEKIFVIERVLLDRETKILTPREQAEIDQRIYESITLLWQTDELRRRRKTVSDEVDNVLFYMDEVLFEVLPGTLLRLQDAVERTYGKKIHFYPILKFGSWVGGDRDGNPYVTHEITMETVRRQKETILNKYIEVMKQMKTEFSQSLRLAGASSQLIQSIEKDARLLPRYFAAVRAKSRQEPYRKKISMIQRKLINTLRLNAKAIQRRTAPDETLEAGYSSAAEFRTEILLLIDSLKKNKGNDILNRLERLLACIDLFGFHFMKLEIRENTNVVEQAAGEIVDQTNWAQEPFARLPLEEKERLLVRLIKGAPHSEIHQQTYSPATEQFLSTLQAVADIRAEEGP